MTTPSIAAAKSDMKQKNRMKFSSCAMYPTLKMKISRLTNETMTSMMAVSGSSTQPSCNHCPPNWNQLKPATSRNTPFSPWCSSVALNAHSESRNARTIEPMASVAASLRCRCLLTAITPDAASGSTGINHRFCAIQVIPSNS